MKAHDKAFSRNIRLQDALNKKRNSEKVRKDLAHLDIEQLLNEIRMNNAIQFAWDWREDNVVKSKQYLKEACDRYGNMNEAMKVNVPAMIKEFLEAYSNE